MDVIDRFFCRVDEAVAYLSDAIGACPQTAVVLTGGMQGFTDAIEAPRTIVFSDIPHFAVPRVKGHEGSMVFGRVRGRPVVAVCGRYHYYEGHHPADVVLPSAVLGVWGVREVITTNAVGGIREDLDPGDIMAVTDHINMMGVSPLIGLAVQRSQGQFVNMIDAYDPALIEIARTAASSISCVLKEGVYAAVSGPNYETKAEIRSLRVLGADAVGMSTVPEVIALRFLDVRVLALSCIANPAADRHGGVMSHHEVLEAINSAAPRMVELLTAIVGLLPKS